EKGLEFAGSLSRTVPEDVLARRALPPLEQAVRLVHTPLTLEDTRHGMAHLRYEEAFILQAIFAPRRDQDERTPAPALAARVLLQGDVGSGKTVVALRAMLRAVDSGHQAALLAPTEVLAEQHHRTLLTLLGDLARAGQLDGHEQATRVRLLTGSQRTAGRRETLLDVTPGQAGIVVGTHALLTDSVEFASLGLVVIDEQHRFGVDHRRRLRTKGPAGQS